MPYKNKEDFKAKRKQYREEGRYKDYDRRYMSEYQKKYRENKKQKLIAETFHRLRVLYFDEGKSFDHRKEWRKNNPEKCKGYYIKRKEKRNASRKINNI